jgi:hypothetical protein
LCKLSFPVVGLKMSSLPTLVLKPNKIFIWYLWNLLTTHSSSFAPHKRKLSPVFSMSINIENFN